MDTPENAQAIADLLNELLAADPNLAQRMFSQRFGCSKKLIASPTFPVSDTATGGQIGVLGVINGLFSEKNMIAASQDQKTGKILRFQVMDLSGGSS